MTASPLGVFWTLRRWNIGYHAVFSIAIRILLTEPAAQPHVKLTAQPEGHVAVPVGSNWTDRQACQFGELPGYWLRREVGTDLQLPVMHLHVGSFPPGWLKAFGGP